MKSLFKVLRCLRVPFETARMRRIVQRFAKVCVILLCFLEKAENYKDTDYKSTKALSNLLLLKTFDDSKAVCSFSWRKWLTFDRCNQSRSYTDTMLRPYVDIVSYFQDTPTINFYIHSAAKWKEIFADLLNTHNSSFTSCRKWKLKLQTIKFQKTEGIRKSRLRNHYLLLAYFIPYVYLFILAGISVKVNMVYKLILIRCRFYHI